MEVPLPSGDLERIQAELVLRQPAYLADLEHLVSIDCGSFSRSGVNEVATWVAEYLDQLGARVIRHGHDVFGDTVVGSFDSGVGGPTVLLIGHMDTVFDDGTASAHPFAIRDGRAVGPGVGDMKGGLLNGLHALAALRAANESAGSFWPRSGRVVLVANPDEEVGSPSSSPIIREQARAAAAALVLEGARPDGAIVSARKGMMHFEISLTGRSAHAGVEPQRGRSAVLEAAHKTVALHALNGRWDGVTVNVGSIRGGSRPNIVPDQALVQVDLRAADPDSQDAATAAIKYIIETSTVPGVRSATRITADHRPMQKSDASTGLLRLATAIASDLGFGLRDTATGGGSDANAVSAMGIPTLDGLGPIAGSPHTPADYIEIDSIVPRATLLAGLVSALLSGAPRDGQRR